MIRGIASLCIGIIFGVQSGSSQSLRDVTFVVDSFLSQGKIITVERYEPKKPGKYPCVILVHGSAGVYSLAGKDIPSNDNFGEQELAAKGYVALVVHYFDSSGIASTSDTEFMRANSALWLRTLSDAVSHAERLPTVDPNRIGLLGESLGAFLSLALAAQDMRIHAVSEYSGGLEDSVYRSVKRMPPVLIQHGELDTIVSVGQTRKLESLLKSLRVPHRIKTYPSEGHYFRASARRELLETSLLFFDENLKSKQPTLRQHPVQGAAMTTIAFGLVPVGADEPGTRVRVPEPAIE